MIERNAYLISCAFRNYLRAALFSSAFMQLTVMIDAMVAGHFIGPDALTAINLTMPLITFVAALSTLIGLGPAIMAAKFIGSRQTEKVNSVYSSAMYQAILIGSLQTLGLLLFLPQVGGWLCSSEHLLPYLMDYLQVLPFTFFLLMIVYTMISLAEADGHPHFAAKAVALGSVLNVVFDVVLVKFFGFGIQGLALAMFANYLTVLLYFFGRMKHEGVSYRWIRPRRSIFNVTLAGLKEGAPMMLNDLLYSLTLYGVNTLLQLYCGENELYLWAIFIQLLLVMMVVVDCAEGAMLSIGSVLEGEKDSYGLRALVKRLWFSVGGIILFIVILICLFPVQVALLFGDSTDVPAHWSQAVRILSLMLVPYALTTFSRSVFQVLGDRMSGVAFSLGQLLLTVAALYVFARWSPDLLWWSFPIASWTLFAVQILYLGILRHRRQIRDFSIIPYHPKKNTLDLSVGYSKESVTEAIRRVCSFMQEYKASPLMEMKVSICCEELMMNVVLFQSYKVRSFMDLSISVDGQRVFVVLKDSGRPFNPVLPILAPSALERADVPLGLFLVNRVSSDLSHKYMYGLNVVFADFVDESVRRPD